MTLCVYFARSPETACYILMTSSLGAKNYVVQARKAAINGNYDHL